MVMEIDLNQPLTDEQKRYLRDRGRGREVEENEANFSSLENGEGGDEDEDLLPYDDMTNEDLRQELAARSLPTSGNKSEMIARLEEDDARSADSVDPEN